MPDSVAVNDLVKIYPNGTKAVDAIDFTIPEGEFFGFLGPNGAGKSTTLKVLSTLLPKTSGQVTVAGHDVDHDRREVRRRIGFAMQEVGIDDLAKAVDFLTLQGILYGQKKREATVRAHEMLELVGLSHVANGKVGGFSGGMRRRVDLASALMHHPKVLFLDEPTTGLDPQSRLAIWDYLRDLNRQGVSILLTTQMMEEADALCERLAIIDNGKIVAQGTPAQLKQTATGETVHVMVEGDSLQAAQTLVATMPGVTDAEIDEGALHVSVANGTSFTPQVVSTLTNAGFSVTDLSVTRPTLEDIFLQLTGHHIRDEGASGDGFAQVNKAWMGLSKN